MLCMLLLIPLQIVLMNLKLRLNLIITALLLITMIIGAVLTIKNARQNIQAEISSTAILGLHILDAEIVRYNSALINKGAQQVKTDAIFELTKFQNIRHLKIDYFDISGELKDSNRITTSKNELYPPNWFIYAMGNVINDIPITNRPVFAHNKRIGELVMTPDVSYELTEEWNETKGILILLGLFFISVNLIVYFSVTISLRPIDNILVALSEIEDGNLASRLPKFTLPELTNISDKFNMMAKTLQSSIEKNSHLSQQLIRLQESERKHLAQELHDEIGQHLTAIHMDAAVIKGTQNINTANESAIAIDSVVKRMLEIVRTMLQRLRPSDLDELGLETALRELVSQWLERNPSTVVDIQVIGDFDLLDDTLLITIYRLVQEGLTNITRHSKAKHVVLHVKKEKNIISMIIKDDGQGFSPSNNTTGFGLAGMRERVEGFSGKFGIKTALNQGVLLTIELPCGK